MSRKTFVPAAWCLPLPVSIIGTTNEDGTANAMNAAWTGQYDSTQIVLCLSAGHKTTKNIKRTKEFTVSMGTKQEIAACDFVGISSGNNDPDKIKKTGWTVIKSEKVDAPTFAELLLTLECKLVGETSNGNLVGDIVAITCDEKYLGEDGKPDLDKIELITFNSLNNSYHEIGGEIAKAWTVGKKLM